MSDPTRPHQPRLEAPPWLNLSAMVDNEVIEQARAMVAELLEHARIALPLAERAKLVLEVHDAGAYGYVEHDVDGIGPLVSQLTGGQDLADLLLLLAHSWHPDSRDYILEPEAVQALRLKYLGEAG